MYSLKDIFEEINYNTADTTNARKSIVEIISLISIEYQKDKTKITGLDFIRSPRELELLLKWLKRKGSFQGQILNKNLFLKGFIKKASLKTFIEAYLNLFIFCSNCYKKDVNIQSIKNNKIIEVICHACGNKSKYII